MKSKSEHKGRKKGIDLGLAILATLPKPQRGYFTHEEIAQICGCSKAYIQLVEIKALQKLKRFAKRDPELAF